MKYGLMHRTILIQCAESKYGLRIQFLPLDVIIYEVWLNA